MVWEMWRRAVPQVRVEWRVSPTTRPLTSCDWQTLTGWSISWKRQ